MIKRSGFVSNSSSSSFIIGLAKVTKANKEFDKVINIDPDNPSKLLDISWPLKYKFIDDNKFRVFMRSFLDTEVSIEVKDGDKIIYLYGTGPDEDQYFWKEDYYDYDIELEEFDENDVVKYNRILSYKGSATYGAGRNG